MRIAATPDGRVMLLLTIAEAEMLRCLVECYRSNTVADIAAEYFDEHFKRLLAPKLQSALNNKIDALDNKMLEEA